MSLLRLELIRLTRTHRWMIIAGVFGFFSIGGPLLARYLAEFLEVTGGGVVVNLPPQRPVDGIVQYVKGISELGVLAAVIVAAGALAMDSRVEAAAFLRTRVAHVRALLIPRYAVVAAAVVAVLFASTVIAWLMTGWLIGDVPIRPVVIGTLYEALYWCFVVAVVAAAAGFVRGAVGTIFTSLAVLIALPLLAQIRVVRPWAPSELLNGSVALLHGASEVGMLRAGGVALGAVVVLLVLAGYRLRQREL